MAEKTILIFGVSSFVGSNIAYKLKNKYKVVGTYEKYRVSIPGVLTFPCDVMQKNSVQTVIYTFKPDFTIYTVGLTSVNDCEQYPNYADMLNSVGIVNVATFSERYKSKLCYISSSLIFEGADKIYLEDDTPMPNTVYGKTVGASEFYIQKSCLNYLILRTCKLYGRSINPRQLTWMEYLQRNFIRGESVGADDTISHGFLDVELLPNILEICFKQNITNRMFHVCSKDVLTYYEFSQVYADIFKENSALISKGSWNFPEIDPQRSEYHVSGKLKFQLDISNIENFLNIMLPTIKESLQFSYSRLGGGGGEGGSSKSSKKNDGGGITFI